MKTRLVLLVALVLSLFLNVKQACESTARGQELYKIGLRDGALYALGEIERRVLEQELIEEREAKLAREKL